MFAHSPLKGSEVYSNLADPVAANEEEGLEEGLKAGELVDRRAWVRRRAYFLGFVLLVCGATAYVMYQDSDPSCDFATHSALPFSLITQSGGRYRCLMTLTSLAIAAALCYPISVVLKPRPYFLHVAGCYLVVNALTLCSEVGTVWAGCYNGVAFFRVATAYLSVIGFVACFCLMQYSILLKAEALNSDASEEEKKRGALRKAFKAIFNPFTVAFAVISSVVPLGLVHRGPTWTWSIVVLTQAAFMVIFGMLLLMFTALAIKEMRKCHSCLARAALDRDQMRWMKNLLAVHALATLFANFTTMCLFMSIAGVILRFLPPYLVLVAFAVDNVSQMTCALALSGMVASMCKKDQNLVPLLEAEEDCHVEYQKKGAEHTLEEFKLIGEAAQRAEDFIRSEVTADMEETMTQMDAPVVEETKAEAEARAAAEAEAQAEAEGATEAEAEAQAE
eukprot:TRINITY_DN181_c0_g2_i1.p1 TRINITY_DN181_c0_g2~~TRINITY_DN181_c0_g2_i1.p1  ORF type:complete len:473 (+),score=102.16 TRINITY_DN181_c0_g2_i1:76-1419(+)